MAAQENIYEVIPEFGLAGQLSLATDTYAVLYAKPNYQRSIKPPGSNDAQSNQSPEIKVKKRGKSRGFKLGVATLFIICAGVAAFLVYFFFPKPTSSSANNESSSRQSPSDGHALGGGDVTAAHTASPNGISQSQQRFYTSAATTTDGFANTYVSGAVTSAGFLPVLLHSLRYHGNHTGCRMLHGFDTKISHVAWRQQDAWIWGSWSHDVTRPDDYYLTNGLWFQNITHVSSNKM